MLVKANTSPELIRKSLRVLEMVMRWGEERKLTFSKEKTCDCAAEEEAIGEVH